MLSYEIFFLILLISIIGPVAGLLALVFYNMLEKQTYLLRVENRQITLEKELEKSRFIQLNQQIQPHFLFNSLNSLYGLVRLKKYDILSQSFEHMVLYIRSKYQEKDALILLEEEISHTQHYLEIQMLRFGYRLEVIWDVNEVVNKALTVPYLLQTLVENSFKHGIEMIEGDALLQITIQIVDHDVIQMVVQDNGPGFQGDPFLSKESGIGLINVKRRLELLFGNKSSITIQDVTKQNSGGVIIVNWPLTYQNLQ
ncbi:sensor histidine kinase YesM [Bacillus mesophilus]|uniref:Sensor histidine kinase n=1 Tax=Bacillus mesophilus TaxID=1808955 RepID=A0A6M0Q7V5_9BACI|nr:histidine kinase [Bacillus mesophilus]MBM7661681.1 sensor histidine kinase YesM [Bacillus mesophilus]NEY72343.1 sensor histidine kinase [Bacillus mesophilus]